MNERLTYIRIRGLANDMADAASAACYASQLRASTVEGLDEDIKAALTQIAAVMGFALVPTEQPQQIAAE